MSLECLQEFWFRTKAEPAEVVCPGKHQSGGAWTREAYVRIRVRCGTCGGVHACNKTSMVTEQAEEPSLNPVHAMGRTTGALKRQSMKVTGPRSWDLWEARPPCPSFSWIIPPCEFPKPNLTTAWSRLILRFPQAKGNAQDRRVLTFRSGVDTLCYVNVKVGNNSDFAKYIHSLPQFLSFATAAETWSRMILKEMSVVLQQNLTNGHWHVLI